MHESQSVVQHTVQLVIQVAHVVMQPVVEQLVGHRHMNSGSAPPI